jgi:hypothetical protein
VKFFRDLKQNKKSIIIWGLLILASCTMLQNGASATAMAFNGRHFDFFSVNLDAQGSVRSGSQNFDWGYQYRGDGFGDDGGQRHTVFTKGMPVSHDLGHLAAGMEILIS